jgi:site-specific recombinase XerD
MRRERQNDLLTLVQSFFRNYLEGMRGASHHTIRAYRDTLRLFFLFLAQRRGGSAANLTLPSVPT